MNSSAHIDNKKKDILVPGKGTNTRITTYINCWKNVFYQFYSDKKEI